MSILLIVFIVLIVLAIGGGTLGYSKWGAYGYSPVGLIVVVLLLMFVFGAFRGA